MFKIISNLLPSSKNKANNKETENECLNHLKTNEKLLIEIKKSLSNQNFQIESLSQNTTERFSQLPQKNTTKSVFFHRLFTCIMTIISLLSAYVTIEVYIQVKSISYDMLNATWSIEKNTVFNDKFELLEISTEDNSEDINTESIEITIDLGDLSYLTGTMTIINHENKEIINLFIKAQNFQITNLILPSKLYLWEFLNGVPTIKDFGLTIKPINSNYMEVSGFNIINQTFNLNLPNNIRFKTTSKIKLPATNESYTSQVLELFCFDINILKSAFTYKAFPTTYEDEDIKKYCLN